MHQATPKISPSSVHVTAASLASGRLLATCSAPSFAMTEDSKASTTKMVTANSIYGRDHEKILLK